MATQPAVSGKIVWSRGIPSAPEVEPGPVRLPALKSGPLPPPLDMRLGVQTGSGEKKPGQEPELPGVEHVAQAPVVAEVPVRRTPGRGPVSPDQSMEEIAAGRPEEVAKAVRTLLLRKETAGGEAGAPAAARKAAVLMIALGSDIAAGILKYLSDLEIETVARAIAEVDLVSPEQQEAVLGEMKRILVEGKFIARGGVEFIRDALQKALDPHEAWAVLDHIPGAADSGFHLLQSVDPNQVVPFISKEHPQTIALILSRLDPSQAARMLSSLPAELQTDVSFRIARMDNISPQALRRLEEAVAQELQAILAGQIVEIGGPRAVAEILNRTGRTTEKAVLEFLDKGDAHLAEEVRNQMFVFDDLVKLTDRDIQMFLREVDLKDLAVALKGTGDKLRERICANLSEETRKEVEEEMKYSGPIRMSDVEETQLRIVQIVRKLEADGKVTIERGDARDVFV